MKLTRASQNRFLRLFSAVMLTVCALLFFGIRFILREEMDDNLRLAKASLEDHLSEFEADGVFNTLQGDLILLNSISTPNTNYEVFRDTVMLSTLENEQEPFRVFQFPIQIDQTWYDVNIHRKRVENLDLLMTIALWAFGMPLLIFILAFLWNRRQMKHLWEPFYRTLAGLRSFTLQQNKPLSPSPTGIDEFDEMQTAVHSMQTKMLSDYRNLKEYTENASHEIQTPLATILAHTESLLQNASSRAVAEDAEAIQLAAQRLSRLQQALLLLTRIENRQFHATETLSLDDLILAKQTQLSALAENRRITLNFEPGNTTVIANRELMESLIHNLLTNATKHNIENGIIEIKLSPSALIVRNTGKPPDADTEELKQRFVKSEPGSSSPGLGLAIVDEICELYGWDFDYLYSNGLHIVQIDFSDSTKSLQSHKLS